MRTSMRVRLGLSLALAAFFGARSASATTVLETGDNGSEQMGRGGAWVARASDPLAAFYNPAGLAGQPTRLTLQANFNIQSTCFTRLKSNNDGTVRDGNPTAANSTIAPGAYFPQVCNQSQPFPDPQIAFTYQVTPRLGLGLAVIGPSAAGQQNWPTTLSDGSPAPQRYLLLSANTLLLTPTLGIGWEPINNLRIGAAFIWGVATFDIANDSWGSNTGNVTQKGGNLSPSQNDIKGELNVSSFFIPGFTAGAIWSPTSNLDIAGWYKFMSTLDAKGSVKTTVGTGAKASVTDTTQANCGEPQAMPAQVCTPNSVELKIPIPMEAKVGVRFHQPRQGVEQAHRRDPMATDVYDIEADLTWANDSAFQQIGITLPNVAVNGSPGVNLPPDASVIHNFQDVFGARLGGDYNLLPNVLAIRAGGYYQTAAQPSQYQNIDFVGAWEFGLALGGTVRIPVGETKALELSLGFGHTFIGTTTNTTQNGVAGLAGTPCNNSFGTPPGSNTTSPSNPSLCTDGTKQYRTEWPVNLGTITSSFSQINVGASFRF